jgi:predicted alpha/beta superfamily hydrolase
MFMLRFRFISIFLLCFLLLAVTTQAQSTVNDPERLELHPDIVSRHLPLPHTIAVYLPKGYMSNTTQSYPVLYLHDGNNLFDGATAFMGQEWRFDEIMDRMIEAGEIEPFIAVGIYNTADRMMEYTPTADAEHGGGGADAYGRFLVEEVKPMIDKNYRTLKDRKHTGIMGSSLGGLVSLHLTWMYPQVFGLTACVSPSLWWNDRSIIKRVSAAGVPPKPLRIWLCGGSAEGEQIPGEGITSMISNLRDVHALFKKQGLKPGRDFVVYEDTGAGHNEAAWSRRLHLPLSYLFGHWRKNYPLN